MDSITEKPETKPPAETKQPASPKKAAAHAPIHNRKPLYLGASIALVLVVVLLLVRAGKERHLAADTAALDISSVTVVHPTLGASQITISLPGDLMAYSETSIYAHTAGYLKVWYTDLGAKVTTGQLMAEISAPDLDAQVNQAQANLAQANANMDIAKLNYSRQMDLLAKKVSSQQEFDQDRANFEAASAAAKAATANAQNLNVKQGFEKVLAPFPGVVTQRLTDVGDLITDASTSAQTAVGKQLFDLARTDILRVFVYVPQVYSSLVKLGAPADLQVIQFPNEKFEGKIAHISGAIDQMTRTLLVEVQVPNQDGRLFPGAYAEVHLVLPVKTQTMLIPVNAIIFRSEGLQVAVVGPDNTIHLTDVKVGHDFGTNMEITAGLKISDQIVINPPDSLSNGTKVQIAEPPKPAAS